MRRTVGTLALLAATAATAEMAWREAERYDGHVVVTADIADAGALGALRAAHPEWDVWSNDCELRLGPNDIHLPPAGIAALRERNVSYSLMVPDLQAAVERTRGRANTSLVRGTDPWFDQYHTYEELFEWYAAVPQRYPALATWQIVGASTEGRGLGLLTIDTKKGATKKAYFQAGIHAREWISPATGNFIVNELLTKYGTDADVTALLDQVTLYVVPVVNPDGYTYTWTNNRMWRKNRRPNGGGSFGVDINRNYGSHWGCCGGSSGDPNSETYRGPAPFSEPESSALSRVFTSLRPGGGLDLHSYSQLILRAWGWTREDCPDETDLRTLGDAMRQAFAVPYGTQFTNQKKIDLYVTDGTASDWMYDPVEGAGAKYSYSIELRDTGRYGFVLPPEQIVPSGEETFLAIKEWLRRIASE